MNNVDSKKDNDELKILVDKYCVENYHDITKYFREKFLLKDVLSNNDNIDLSRVEFYTVRLKVINHELLKHNIQPRNINDWDGRIYELFFKIKGEIRFRYKDEKNYIKPLEKIFDISIKGHYLNPVFSMKILKTY